jgi:BirA family transcriptional regulator, biotin operon repressor / biotin---[acetyl-CoA-carboxylase] ligase
MSKRSDTTWTGWWTPFSQMRSDRIATVKAGKLGSPRLHLRRTDSTNERARALAISGAPHGTLVSADEQTAGRGRQGRTWSAPPNSALLCSLVLRWPISDRPPELLSLIAGVAVCEAVGERAKLKWPNDVVLESPTPTATSAVTQRLGLAKLAGILVEGRIQEGWAVLGIGLNVAVRLEHLPTDVGERAATLDLPASSIEVLLSRLVGALERLLCEPLESVLAAWRDRDALLGREISWSAPRHMGGDGPSTTGRASGIDEAGRLVVTLTDGSTRKLDAGEVHLGPAR